MFRQDTLECSPKLAHNIHRDVHGGLVCDIEGHKCSRCYKSYGYINLFENHWCWCCGDINCLRDDRKCSKIAKSKAAEDSKDASQRFGAGVKFYDAHVTKLKNINVNPILSWAKIQKNFLVAYGVPKSGKTYLCMALANYFIQQGKDVRYYKESRFFEQLHKCIEANKSQYTEIDRISSAEILILDDLGSSKPNDWRKDIMFNLIETRYSNELPTIITTTCDDKSLADLYDIRLSNYVFDENQVKVFFSKTIDLKV